MYAGDAVSRGPITVARVSTIAQACDRLRPSSRIFATIARSNDSCAARDGNDCAAEDGGSGKTTKHGKSGRGRVDERPQWMLSVNGSTRPPVSWECPTPISSPSDAPCRARLRFTARRCALAESTSRSFPARPSEVDRRSSA